MPERYIHFSKASQASYVAWSKALVKFSQSNSNCIGVCVGVSTMHALEMPLTTVVWWYGISVSCSLDSS